MSLPGEMLELCLGAYGSGGDSSGGLQLQEENFQAAVSAELWHSCQPVAAVAVFY